MTNPTKPRTPVIGFVGAGQLARMSIQAAIPLDVEIRLLAAQPTDGAALVSPHVTVGAPNDLSALEAFAAGCDVVTFDHELVDVEQLRQLEQAGRRLRPSAATIAIAQNKWRQRSEFHALGLPVPPHHRVERAEDIANFARMHGWPVVVKAVRGGYDGRGVWTVQDATAAQALYAETATAGVALLVEAWVPIDREIAVLAARRPSGETVAYPVIETVQVGGICHELVVPAPIDAALAAEARRIAEAIAQAIDVTGILAVELFVSQGRLLINEIATRPHNSGHFSIEGCITSQFENHLRAVLDWPLGATDLRAPAVATVNLLGREETRNLVAGLRAALALPDVHVHLYGKAPRPGRKLGHVTALGQDPAETRERARQAAALVLGTAA